MKPASRWVQTLTWVKPQEQRIVLASIAMAFVLMASYFVLRPVRDALASDWSDAEVSLLWNIQFVVSVVMVSVYGFALSKFRLKWIVPAVYGLFASSFLCFFWLTPSVANPTFLEKLFYLWVATFSLFNLSVFWSFMAEIYDAEQGRRLFALIGIGASAGAIVGPTIPVILANRLGLDALMLVSAVGLLLVIPIIYYLQSTSVSLPSQSRLKQLAGQRGVTLGGRWWAGFSDVVRSRYLLGIGAFILLYVFIGTFVYFQQKNLLADFARVERVQILGSIDWLVNVLTFLLASMVTNRLIAKLGMPVTLALVPIALFLGLLVLAFAPLVVVLLAIQVARRVGNYAITRPAREMLFTRVSTEQRYKAKPVIDVVVYRGGDAVSSTLFALLSEGLGLGLAALSLVGAMIASLWAAVGSWLGHLYTRLDSRPEPRVAGVAIPANNDISTRSY